MVVITAVKESLQECQDNLTQLPKSTNQMKLETINNLSEEISYLKKRSELLDEILKYYDTNNMTFNVPANWGKHKSSFYGLNLKQIPKSPRHALNKKISELLPYLETMDIVNWEEIDKSLADKKPVTKQKKNKTK